MRLAIVEDSPTLLENLRLVLGGEGGISVVGAFDNAEDALSNLKRLSPEIMLVDIGLPGISGVEFIRLAKEKSPRLEMLVYSISQDWKTVSAAFDAGAMGYILKSAKPRQLVEAVHDLHEGGAPMSPRIARMLITAFYGRDNGNGCSLSRREKEILTGLDKGMTYREIAKELILSPYTVRTHIRNIYEKLPATSKSEAIRKAKKNGLL